MNNTWIGHAWKERTARTVPIWHVVVCKVIKEADMYLAVNQLNVRKPIRGHELAENYGSNNLIANVQMTAERQPGKDPQYSWHIEIDDPDQLVPVVIDIGHSLLMGVFQLDLTERQNSIIFLPKESDEMEVIPPQPETVPDAPEKEPPTFKDQINELAKARYYIVNDRKKVIFVSLSYKRKSDAILENDDIVMSGKELQDSAEQLELKGYIIDDIPF